MDKNIESISYPKCVVFLLSIAKGYNSTKILPIFSYYKIKWTPAQEIRELTILPGCNQRKLKKN